MQYIYRRTQHARARAPRAESAHNTIKYMLYTHTIKLRTATRAHDSHRPHPRARSARSTDDARDSSPHARRRRHHRRRCVAWRRCRLASSPPPLAPIIPSIALWFVDRNGCVLKFFASQNGVWLVFVYRVHIANISIHTLSPE